MDNTPPRLVETRFLHAARCGDLEALQSTLRSFKLAAEECTYHGIYSRNEDVYFDHNDVKYKALQIAAQNGHANIVKELLHMLDPSGCIFQMEFSLSLCHEHKTPQETPIRIAVKEGHLAVVQEIISHYHLQIRQLAINSDWVEQLVEWAVHWGHARIVEFILCSFAHQATKLPLHLAAHLAYERFEVFKMLLDYISEVPAHAHKAPLYSEDGLTAFHLAAQSGSLDAVRSLANRAGTDVNARSFPELFTALHMAADLGHVHIVSFLLQMESGDIAMDTTKDVDKMATDCMGRTALHYAAQEGHEAVVDQLLNCCPGMASMTDNDGFLPIHMAAREGHAKVVKQLRSHGGLNRAVKHSLGVIACAEDEYMGRRITQYPSYFGKEWRFPRPRMLNALFWRTEGFTPLHFAARYRHRLVLKELLREGADDVDLEERSCGDFLLKDSQGFLAYDSMGGQNQLGDTLMECVRQEKHSEKVVDSLPEASFTSSRKMMIRSRRSEIALDIDEERKAMEELQLAWETRKPPKITMRILRWLEDEELGRGRTYWIHEAVMGGNDAVLKMILELEDIDLNEEHPLFGSALQFSLDSRKYGAATALLQKSGRCVLDDRIMRRIFSKKSILQSSSHDESFQRCLAELVKRGAGNVTFLARLLQWAGKRKGLERLVEVLLSQPELKRGLNEDRQVYLDSANAVLVGAALIAGVAFQGWLQPPLGYANPISNNEVGYAQVRQRGMESFWWFNNGAFFFSVATLIAGAKGAVPTVEKTSFVNSVTKVKRAVAVASVLLGLALVCIVGAFTAAGFAVLPPHSHSRRIMHLSLGLGGPTCALVLLWFSLSVWPLLLEILDNLATQALRYLEQYKAFQKMLAWLLHVRHVEYPTNFTPREYLKMALNRCRYSRW